MIISNLIFLYFISHGTYGVMEYSVNIFFVFMCTSNYGCTYILYSYFFSNNIFLYIYPPANRLGRREVYSEI